MIISRTPLRISFCGGGTDLPSFYKSEFGAVVSASINKYVYITVNKKFDEHIRVSYSETEITDDVNNVKHPLFREAMKLTGVNKGVEITSISDIPSKGTGLGSSSSFTVGILNALYAYSGRFRSASQLADDACKIEIDILGEPIGKQDQYIAAFGGLQYIQFNPDGSVFVDPIICPLEKKRELAGNLLMFYTGITRRSNSILAEQSRETPKKMQYLVQMRDLALKARDALNKGNISSFGELLHQNWILKKKLAEAISNEQIDAYYEKALSAGALGGKLLGAGGGGFLLFYAEQSKHAAVRNALSDLKELKFEFEPQGTKIIYVGD